MGKIKKENIARITMFMLLIIYAISMAIATFIENSYGTPVAKKYIYYSPWFLVLEFLLACNLLYAIIKGKMIKMKQWGSLLFHLAFIIILAGAAITHFFSYEGIMHIREGDKSTHILMGESMEKKEVPFEVYLKEFKIQRYPGSSSPSSFESHITLITDEGSSEKTISMNNVLDVKGYRLFQTSYDKDEQGTVLTVNYDKAGMIISYIGCLLLISGMIISLFQKNSRFRQLISKLKEISHTTSTIIFIIVSLSCLSSPLYADNSKIMNVPSVSKEQADLFGKIVVQNPKGRLEPANSWTLKIASKLFQDKKFEGYTSEQVFLNLFVYPYQWNNAELIKVKNKEIVSKFGKSGDYLSFNDLFDSDGNYILQKETENAYRISPSERSRFDNDLLKLDESANIIRQIQQGMLLAIFPQENDSEGKWYSAGDDLSFFRGKDSLFVSKIMIWYASELTENNEKQASEILNMINTYQVAKNKVIPVNPKKIEAEIWYNKAQLFSSIFKYYLALGIILLLCIITSYFSRKEYLKIINSVLIFLISGAFILHTAGLALRWYISGYAPWTNSYESMIYLSWVITLGGLIFASRFRVATALSTLLAGILLFVAHLNQMNPEITPLIPVLQSFWLMLHVAVIMAGYGFFFICAMIGLFNLIMMIFGNNEKIIKSVKELTILNEISMILGLIFMTAGTILGAIWANESWGRYWGWDPKETWALISIIVYTIVLHLRFMQAKDKTYLFNLLSVVALGSVLMTYFGVNYYLSGMHSYGKTAGEIMPLPLIGGILIVIIIAIYAKKRNMRI